MRRFVGLTVLAASLAVPTTALALVAASSDDGVLSVKNGAGKVVLAFNGSAVGRLSHGKIVLTDPVFGDGEGFDVWGCDSTPLKTDTTEVCSGENIRFRAVGGRYKIVIKGSGIFLSAVGNGTVVLNGAGDDPTVESDGVYSLNDAAYRSLPNTEKTFELATPSGG